MDNKEVFVYYFRGLFKDSRLSENRSNIINIVINGSNFI